MRKEFITTKQAIAIMVLFMIGSSMIHIINFVANQDFWIAYLFVILIALFVFFMYSRIISLFPQKNLLDIFIFLYGKIAGSIVYGAYVFYAFTLGCIIPRHFTEFIQTISLPETPQYAFAICIILVSIYIAKKGIETLGRWSLFSLPIIIFIFMITIIFSIKLFDLQNLKPFFQSSVSQIAENTWNSFSLPFGECVIFLLLFDSLKNGKKSLKVFYIGLAIGVTMIVLGLFRNILVLGIDNNKLLSSPSIGAVSVIQITSFLERIEVIVTIIFIICGLTKGTVLLMGASKGIGKLLQLDSDRPLIVPIGLLMLMFSFNFFENIMRLNEWFKSYRLFFLPLQVLVPLVTWIIAEIKTKTQKKREAIKNIM